jgi:hypothetical protein
MRYDKLSINHCEYIKKISSKSTAINSNQNLMTTSKFSYNLYLGWLDSDTDGPVFIYDGTPNTKFDLW